MEAKLLSGAAVAALVALSLSGTPPAFASNNLTDAVPKSHALDVSTSIASGTLRDREGNPVADAELKVFAYPENIDGSTGASFNLIEIGTAKSGRDGSYSITADYSGLDPTLKRSKKPAVPINVSIVASTAEADTILGTTLWMDRSGKKAVIHRADLEDSAAINSAATTTTLQRTTATSATTPILDLTLAEKSPQATEQAGMIQPYAGVPGNCRVITNYGPRQVSVGQIASTTTSGYSQSLKYSSSSSSTLGIGVSNSGAYWSFNLSGSTTVSTSSSTTFPAISTATSKFLRTNFNYSKIRCSYGTANPVIKYEMRAISFAGGASTATASAPSASYCTKYTGGSTFVKNTSVATSFSAGAKTASAIGIDLLSRTGYSSATAVTTKFKNSKKLCGHQGYPGSTPGILVVKP